MVGIKEIIDGTLDRIRKAMAEERLFGRMVNGGNVTIDVEEGDKVQLQFVEKTEPEPVA